MKALQILQSGKSVSERADVYSKAIKRDIQYNIIDQLARKKEKLVEEKFDAENFNLATDLNKGMKQMTQEDCYKRFERLITIDYEITLLDAEIKAKQNSFISYFGEEALFA